MTGTAPAVDHAEPSRTYTVAFDGACVGNPGPGGWGAVLQRHETGQERRLSGSIPGTTTNNRAELSAAIKALDYLRPGATVAMIGDSQYVVLGVTEWLPGWKQRGWRKPDGSGVLNADLWVDLERAAGRHERVVWEWVRGHDGHPLNEAADRLAGEAARRCRQ